ncbi:MAG: hypothetical protein A2Y81_01085 [Nitrospirae bacterium RBG_13_43_8]|nr:MAG: hypothetical protein A2Y81_01085 [Nitrospirae bacterium RBG_13_43_8]
MRVDMNQKIKNAIPLPIYSEARRVLLHLSKIFQNVYRAVVSDEYCRIYINWNMPPRRWDNMTKIHWCYTRIEWRHRKLYALLSCIAWPLKTCIFAWKRTRQYGPKVKEKTGIAMGRQVLDQIYFAIRHFIPPRAYYFYNLYEAANHDIASLYVHEHEIVSLMRFLNATHQVRILDDKRSFFRECTRLGFQTIPIVAEFEDGKLKTYIDSANNILPKTDLFAKPALGKCGKGIESYGYDRETDRYCCNDGTLITRDQLLRRLSQCSKRSPYIIQERIFNHPEISELFSEALCTIRVVTGRAPSGPAEPLVSTFKMPTNNCINDNFAAGGIAVAVEKTTGVLGKGITRDIAAERVSRHPDTGHTFSGFRIPYWHQIIQLCLRIHDAFPDFSFVGWDVAVTKDGPVLVEANPDWGVEGIQRAHYVPLGMSRFAELFILHIKQQDRFNSILDPNFWTPDYVTIESHSLHQDVLR